MARSLIQRRQEAERARVEAYDACLRRVSQQPRLAPDFQTAINEAQHGFTDKILRDISAWRPRIKTRDAARLRLAAARYLFARFPVAAHLEQIWIDSRGLADDEIALRKRWHIVAAGGGSLYREGAGEWLSRKEVHAFLNAPPGLGFNAAFWHAIARSYSDDPAVVARIARSRIADSPRSELAFWRDAVRFFCAYPTTLEEIDDCCDYLEDGRQRNPAFSLRGRTLVSVRRLMREWHRDLNAIARIEAAQRHAAAARRRARGQGPEQDADGGRWSGAAITDWSWTSSAKDRAKREEFMVIQLRTAAELVSETRAMRHCVASYAAKCIAGRASIWSLRLRIRSVAERLLTIELDSQHRAVQVRGFANRMPHADERKVLERWAKARGIELP